jgi:hypothetical protein
VVNSPPSVQLGWSAGQCGLRLTLTALDVGLQTHRKRDDDEMRAADVDVGKRCVKCLEFGEGGIRNLVCRCDAMLVCMQKSRQRPAHCCASVMSFLFDRSLQVRRQAGEERPLLVASNHSPREKDERIQQESR